MKDYMYDCYDENENSLGFFLQKVVKNFYKNIQK